MVQEALNLFFKNSTKNFTFAFFLYQIQKEALELLVYSDFTTGNLFTTVVMTFPCELLVCRCLSPNLHLSGFS